LINLQYGSYREIEGLNPREIRDILIYRKSKEQEEQLNQALG